MSRPKRVRWECPNGTHPAVLGGRRPAADATVRYCLRCSEGSSRLVKRTAPAVERQRAARADRAKAARARRHEREREAAAAAYVVVSSDGVTLDLRDEMEAMFRGSAELRDRLRESGRPSSFRPELVVRRGRKSYVTGVADAGRVVLTVGVGADQHEIREVLLHELIHVVTAALVGSSGRTRRNGPSGRAWHGSLFRTALCRAARELWGTSVHPDDHPEAYGLDDLIQAQVRAAR